MNWYHKKILGEKKIAKTYLRLSKNHKKMLKLAYMSKSHDTEFNDTDASDAYSCKVALTESKKRIVLSVVFMNNIHSFPLYSESWKYPKEETKRAIKTYNRCINIIEDLKPEYEDDDMPGPTLQGMARESLRYVDLDRKKLAPSRSLEAAKYLDGETDWRSSLYGNRLPHQYGHPMQPLTNINITNTDGSTVNFNK